MTPFPTILIDPKWKSHGNGVTSTLTCVGGAPFLPFPPPIFLDSKTSKLPFPKSGEPRTTIDVFSLKLMSLEPQEVLREVFQRQNETILIPS